MLHVNEKYFNSHNQSNILRSKKAYNLKTSLSIIYVKEYFYMFFKDIIQAQSETNIEFAITL